MPKFLLMIIEFFKTGLFAVGGGLATIPFLREISIKYGWFSLSELSTMIAVSESTPGPMGINMATYVGFSQYGILGGIACTLGLVAPSIIIICIIANMLEKFKSARIVQEVFAGLKPAVVAFIATATIDIINTTLFNGNLFTTSLIASFKVAQFICLVVFLILSKVFPKLHPIWFILGCAIVGIIFKF